MTQPSRPPTRTKLAEAQQAVRQPAKTTSQPAKTTSQPVKTASQQQAAGRVATAVSVAKPKFGMAPVRRDGTPGYLMSKCQRSSGKAFFNDKIFKPNAPPFSLRRPNFSASALIFRPLPHVDTISQRAFGSYRVGLGPNEFGDFMREIRAVRSAGFLTETSVTFALYNPENEAYDENTHPYVIFVREMDKQCGGRGKKDKNVIPKDPAWMQINTDLRMPSPKWCVLVQGLVFQANNRQFFGGSEMPKGLGVKDYPQVIEMFSTAAVGFRDRLNEVKEGICVPEVGEEISDSFWEEAMECGDPVHPLYGRFVHVYNPANERIGGEADETTLDEEDPYRDAEASGQSGSGGQQNSRYDVYLDRFIHTGGRVRKDINPRLPSKYWDRLLSRIINWDDLLWFPSNDEVCLWLARAYNGFRSAFEFAWRDYPEFLTAEVRQVLAASKAVSMTARVPTDEDIDEEDRGKVSAVVPEEEYYEEEEAEVAAVAQAEQEDLDEYPEEAATDLDEEVPDDQAPPEEEAPFTPDEDADYEEEEDVAGGNGEEQAAGDDEAEEKRAAAALRAAAARSAMRDKKFAQPKNGAKRPVAGKSKR